MPTDSSGWLWWFISVIVVGIGINLFTTFLYPCIEKAWARYSVNRRAKVQAKEQKFQRQVQWLVEDPERLGRLKLDLILYHLQILAALVLAVFVYTFGQQMLYISTWVRGATPVTAVFVPVLGGAMALVVIVLTNSRLNRISRTRQLVRQAEAKLSADEGPAGTPGEEAGEVALREKQTVE